MSGSNEVIDEVSCDIFDRHVTKIGDVFSSIDFIGSQIATTERINQKQEAITIAYKAEKLEIVSSLGTGSSANDEKETSRSH